MAVKLAFQYSPAIATDSKFGPYTKKQLQLYLKVWKYYTGLIDGDFGSMSTLALQKYLRSCGKYTTAYKLDGVFGSATWTALSKWLQAVNPAVDDFTRSGTIFWLQRTLNSRNGKIYLKTDGNVNSLVAKCY